MRFMEGKSKGGSSAATDLAPHVQRFSSKADACSAVDELINIALLHNHLSADLQHLIIMQPNAQECLNFGAYSHFVILIEGDDLQRESLVAAPWDVKWVHAVQRACQLPPAHSRGAGPSSGGGAGPSIHLCRPPHRPPPAKPCDAQSKLDAAAYLPAGFGA